VGRVKGSRAAIHWRNPERPSRAEDCALALIRRGMGDFCHSIRGAFLLDGHAVDWRRKWPQTVSGGDLGKVMGQVRGDGCCGSSTGECERAARGFAWAFHAGESGRVCGCQQVREVYQGRALNGSEWPLDRMSTLMTILEGGFIY